MRLITLNHRSHPLKLNIVIPIYNEEDNLQELYQRLREVLNQLENIEWQVIYVNDGSYDRSLEMMLDQHNKDARFSIIDLSRNFGHQAAISAGLAKANGDAVIFLDGDLQDPPELIPDLLTRWRDGAHIVRAQRKSRKERGIRRLAFEAFHRFFGWISDFPVPPYSGIYSLFDKQAIDALKTFQEKNRFFPGLRSWVGFKQDVVFYDRKERAAGEPKQSYSRLIRYALDAVFSFSYKPLRIMTGVGICISIVGFFLAAIFVIKRLLEIEVAQTGFTTLVTLVLFLGGIQLIAIGLLGEYLVRIYDEVKQRPLYIIKKLYYLDNSKMK
jgi:dolichol-phosphate mannosyltransferase